MTFDIFNTREKITFDYLDKRDIKDYVFSIKMYYPEANLRDYTEEFSYVKELACMLHKMTIGGDCCHECPLIFRPEKEFDVVMRDGQAYFEEYIYCTRCSMIGLK